MENGASYQTTTLKQFTRVTEYIFSMYTKPVEF